MRTRTAPRERHGSPRTAARWARVAATAAAAAAVCTAVAPAEAPARAHTGATDAAASAFAIRTIRLLAGNRYAAVWQTLHPADQAATGSRARYVRCEREAPIPGHVNVVEALGVRDETASLAGIGRTPTKAVRVRIVFAAAPGLSKGVTVTHTVHVLFAAGGWRWVLPGARYASYRHGRCGPEPPAPPTSSA